MEFDDVQQTGLNGLIEEDSYDEEVQRPKKKKMGKDKNQTVTAMRGILAKELGVDAAKSSMIPDINALMEQDQVR